MTNSEFENQFDVLYNSITSNQAPGLDLYEKSVFLTKAQDEVIKAYFDPKSNKVMEGFDGSERRQIDFSKITKTKSYNSFDNALYDPRENSKSVSLPSKEDGEVLMFLNERIEVTRTGNSNPVYLTVIPIQYSEYNRLMSKPFKRPLHYQAWRVLNYSSNSKADLVVGPSDIITKYTIRYVKRPNPIVLGDLDGLKIDGIGTNSECELDPILHQEILQRAVELAKAAYTGDLQSQVALGQTSQTSIGAVSQAR